MNKFIHKSSVSFLGLILLLRIMAVPLSLLDYALNKNFISNNLCENRLRPEMHCSGKCYLHKQLTRANDNQDSPTQKGTIKSFLNDFLEPLNEQGFAFLGTRPVTRQTSYTERIPSLFPGKIFRPPIA